jgi:tetratricopeptide (TPR) repeat protein
LEFGSGDLKAAEASLALALKFSPSNAPAHALRGFVLAGGNHLAAARSSFLKARELEPFMSQPWLGLGLLKFRAGDRAAGLADLQTAAVLEPNRSLPRSYLGKGYAENFDGERAAQEWKLAAHLDTADPTPWLYRALEDYDANRINSAIDALQRSIALNNNRALYRSESLLDQDQAVRGASLARVYQRAGMPEVALREAAVSVSYDYSNPSAHLFLADAFNALRDPTRFDLRRETAWFNEVLLANALSPVDAGVIAPSLSDQEYTRLFARDGFRLSSVGEARSDGQFRQLATQSGIFGRFAYAIDLDWQHNDGTRPNQRLDRTEVYPQLKYQVTDADTALVLLKFQDYHSGDNFQYLDQTNARPQYRFDEEQSPIAVGIWRHEWKPGVQTLALGGRLENDQRFSDRDAPFALVLKDIVGGTIGVNNLPLDFNYRSRVEIYVGELQHIARLDWSTFVVGARGQWGSIKTFDQLTGDPVNSPDFGDTTGTGLYHRANVRADFSRTTVYGYDTIPLAQTLALTLGVAWDTVELPRNFRHPPIQGGEETESRIEPKVGLVWRPIKALTFRGMYAQSLGGATLDESYRLEPVQLAGFSQAFRTVIPESLVGSVSGHRLDLGGAALDLELPSRTYLGVEFTDTRSAVDREIGAFDFDTSFGSTPPGSVIRARERLRYQEDAVQFTVNQLVGEDFVFGAAYRFAHTRLEDQFSFPIATRETEANLHQFRLSGVVNLSGGWFARANATWYRQDSTRTFGTSPTHSETLQQTDLEAGWRFPRRFGEMSAGILNVFDENYRFEPLSALPDLPRERVFFVRLRLNF